MAVHITNRADTEAIIREQVVSTIFQDAPKQSVFMSLARKLPNMTSNQTGFSARCTLGRWRYWHEADQ